MWRRDLTVGVNGSATLSMKLDGFSKIKLLYNQQFPLEVYLKKMKTPDSKIYHRPVFMAFFYVVKIWAGLSAIKR